MTAPAPRLLLVEFLSTDRFAQYRSDLYPFTSGWARGHGLALRWVCFGYDPDAQPNNPHVVELPGPDRQRLARLISRFAWDKLLGVKSYRLTLACSTGAWTSAPRSPPQKNLPACAIT